jgi:nucleoside-diphosphate-sugar epimerase
MSRLIFGCGYLGLRVARRWLEQGQTVYAVTRSAQRGAELARAGLQPLVADVTRPETLVALPAAQTVLYAVAHDPRDPHSRHEVYVDGLAHVLSALPTMVQRLIFISSTGVYGQGDGDWVNEDTPVSPRREAGREFLAAEELLAQHPLGQRTVVLRAAGLYGPGRVPRQADIRAGRPLPAPTQGYLNLIHVEDLAEIVLAAEVRAVPPCMYLASDGQPVDRRTYYEYVAQLLGAPALQWIAPPPDSPAAIRAGSSKRVDSRRLREAWGVRLRYPGYREGLAAILAEESGKPKAESG